MAGKRIENGSASATVAENITRLRKAHGMSYVDLSNGANLQGRHLSPLAVRRMEEQERRIDVDDLQAIAIALGVTPGDMMRPLEVSVSVQTASRQ